MEEPEGDHDSREDKTDQDGLIDDKDVQEQVDKFYAELEIDQEKQRRRLLRGEARITRRRSTLPAHLHQAMGSANLSLARGETSAAIELCMEVIRQAPYVVEPFLTLSTIYEDIGERSKLLQILLIAATLKRSDPDLWLKVGDLALELDQLSLAAECFSKCFKFDPQNLSVLWRKANIYDELLNFKKAIDTYEQLEKLLPKESEKELVEVVKQLARNYHTVHEDQRAIEILRKAREEHQSFFDDESTNLYTELLITDRRYSEALDVIISFYEIPFTKTSTTTPTSTAHTHESLSLSAALSLSMNMSDLLNPPTLDDHPTTSSNTITTDTEMVNILELPATLPVDLRAKLSVCLIHLHYSLPENILVPLLADPENCGDLLLDIAEAHMENSEYSKALPLLSLLVETDAYNQAEVWLKHAETLHMLQELEQAATSYRTVLSLAPDHTETRMTLASIYSQLGMMEDALTLLDDTDDNLQPHSGEAVDRDPFQSEPHEEDTSMSQFSVSAAPPPSQPLSSQDLRLTHTKFKLLAGESRVGEYVPVGIDMLIFYFRDYYYRRDLMDYFGLGIKVVRSKLRSSRAVEGPEISRPPEEEKALKERENYLTTDEWWQVFFKTCNGLYTSGKYPDVLMRLVMCADVAKKMEKYERSLFLMVYQVCLRLSEDRFAFHFIRSLYFKMIDGTEKHMNPLFWTLMNKVPPTNRQQKFILRQLIKNPNHLPLLKISSNYSLVASSYKFALAQYELAYRSDPDNYLLCLSVAIVYCNLSLQKHSLHRNTLVLQSIAFLHKYLRLRGVCQESYYNVGRLFHQLGLLHYACLYYEKVLILEPDNHNKLTGSKQYISQRLAMADMRREAAFNLSLIYKNSGNEALALHYLTQHCTI